MPPPAHRAYVAESAASAASPRWGRLAAALLVAAVYVSCVLPVRALEDASRFTRGGVCGAAHSPGVDVATALTTCPLHARSCADVDGRVGTTAAVTWRPCTVSQDGTGAVDDAWLAGAGVSCGAGHYRPVSFCEFTRIVLRPTGRLVAPGRKRKPVPATLEGGAAYAMFGVTHSSTLASSGAVRCAFVQRGPAVAATVTYHLGHGNWYHTVLDTLLPLYGLMERRGWLDVRDGLLLPVVEHGGLGGSQAVEGIDWATDAFTRPRREQYWTDALRSVFPSWRLLPLTNATLDALRGGMRGGVCFDSLVAGAPRIRTPGPRGRLDPGMIDRFVAHAARQMRLQAPSDGPGGTRACRGAFIVRNGRRHITNRDELVRGLTAAADGPLCGGVSLLDFDGMSVRQQAAAVRSGEFDVVFGMQGAGMTNALFAPRGTAVAMLHQWGANNDPFRQLLGARGPYGSWVNNDKAKSFADEARDPFHGSADTEVDVAAVVSLVTRLLAEQRDATAPWQSARGRACVCGGE